MYEDALEIFKYLPIRASQNEIDYINHLWASANKLYLDDKYTKVSTRSFSIMPFHILFMLALQYKIFRIKKQRSTEYISRIEKYVSNKDIKKQLLNVNSVFDFGLMGETSLVKLLSIVGLSDDSIGRTISLINHRNDSIAHAKGGFIFEADEKINEYIKCLAEIQKCFELLNNEVAKSWFEEIENEDDLEDFKERKLADAHICSEDFNSGDMLILVNNSSTPFKEWLITKDN